MTLKPKSIALLVIASCLTTRLVAEVCSHDSGLCTTWIDPHYGPEYGFCCMKHGHGEGTKALGTKWIHGTLDAVPPDDETQGCGDKWEPVDIHVNRCRILVAAHACSELRADENCEEYYYTPIRN